MRGKDAEYSNWCDLPPLFMSSLLYYLSPKTRCAFRATCRSWNDATLLLPVPVGSPSSPRHSAPALIHTELETTSYECYFPMTGERFRLSTDETRCREAVVHYSNFGWLLLSETRARFVNGRRIPYRFLFFFNPLTNHIIDHGVDTYGTAEKSWPLCFSSPPTSTDRQELSGMFPLEKLSTTLFMSRVKTWRLLFLALSGDPEVLMDHHLSRQFSIVLHHGLHYCLVGAGVVGVSGINGTVSYTFYDTGLFESGTKLRRSYLIKVDGKLLGIFDYQGIRVLWLDTGKWEWDPVGDEDLRDKILYVSYKGSFVQCDDTTKGVGNKIYFPTIIDGGGVYYSLDTKKYHTLYSELEETEDYGDDSMAWITPTTTS